MWKSHGTKIIGAVGAAASILGAADPTLVAGLLGQSGPFYVTAALSFLTIWRGLTNSKQAQ